MLVLQNRTSAPVSCTAYFWRSAGSLAYEHPPVVLAPNASLTLNTSSIPTLQGQSGSITILHDGGYDGLAGKAVALEPATGFAFDSILVSRPR